MNLPPLLTAWLELENFPCSPAGSPDAPTQDDQNKRNSFSPPLYHLSNIEEFAPSMNRYYLEDAMKFLSNDCAKSVEVRGRGR